MGILFWFLKYKLFWKDRGVIITIGCWRDRDRKLSYSLPTLKTTLTTVYAVEIPEWSRMVVMFYWGMYVDPTPVSWHKVAKTGATLGPRGLAPFIGHSSSKLLWLWIDSVATFTFDFRGSLFEVGGSCGYALPPTRKCNWYIYPGIA